MYTNQRNFLFLIKRRYLSVFLILFLFSGMLNAQNYSQPISINLKNASLKDFFNNIESKSQFTIIYRDVLIDEKKDISIDVTNHPLNEVLKTVLSKKGLQANYNNYSIVITKKPIITGKVQDIELEKGKTVSGIVTDEQGEPIIGAIVRESISNNTTLTNLDGSFTISVLNEINKLNISYIGFVSKEITINNGEFLRINMEESVKELEDVVVVAYGTQRKANLTGSVGTVSSSDLEQRPLTNISAALGGLVPGMMVVQGSGQPGRDGGNIKIRGIGTFGDSSPLVLIDGMIGDMDDINPADIENISVLKDAASSAIYGARAANGVILVTTKKGMQNKKTNVTYENYFGWQQLTNIPNYLNSSQYASLYNEARINDGLTPTFTDDEIELYRNGTDPDHYPNTNWIKNIFTESGFQQNHSITLAGGNENFLYNSSFRYFDQNGLVKCTGNERYNIRVNFTNNLGKRFHTNVILSLSRQTISFPVSSRPDHNSFEEIIHQAHRINPTVINRYSDGTYGTHTDGNPVAGLTPYLLDSFN